MSPKDQDDKTRDSAMGQNAAPVVTVDTPEFRKNLRMWRELQNGDDEGNFLRIVYYIDAHTTQAVAAKQAEIDRLMLEFCPAEMSAEQMSTWEASQRRAPEAAPQQHAQAALSDARSMRHALETCINGGAAMGWISDDQARAILSASHQPAAAPSAPTAMGNAFVTLCENGGRYSIILKFNQRVDAFAAHSYLLFVGGKEYPATPPQEAAARDCHDNAVRLLGLVFDAWENGDDCYEDPENCAGFLGKAFQLDDEVFKECCDLLNRLNPPRNAAPAAQVALADCEKCKGSGAHHYPDGEWKCKCVSCKGTGIKPAAQVAMPDLHDQIMRLPCHGFDHAYKEGHRDARHAAAELAALAAAPSPAQPAPCAYPNCTCIGGTTSTCAKVVQGEALSQQAGDAKHVAAFKIVQAVRVDGDPAFANLLHEFDTAQGEGPHTARMERLTEKARQQGHAFGLEEAAKVAESVGRPVGAGDGGTYIPGTSADAARAIRALNKQEPTA